MTIPTNPASATGNVLNFPALQSYAGGSPVSEGGIDPAAIINQIAESGKTPEEMQKLALSAAMPIPGGHEGIIPASLQYQPEKYTPGQIDRTPVVGAGNARAQGMGNAAIGAMNALAAFRVSHENKRRLQLATDTHTILVAQNAIDEAKQVLRMDPNNQDAKNAITQNEAVMNGILSDEKTRKSLEKGFHIDFTNPQANNTIDHQGVAQGKQMAQQTLQGKSYAQQFMEKTPQTFEANQAAIAKFRIAAQEQQMQVASMKNLVSFMGAMMRFKGQEEMAQSHISAAQIGQIGANARAQAELQNKWDMQTRQFKMDMYKMNGKYAQQLSLIQARGHEAINDALTLYQYKTHNPQAVQQYARSVMMKFDSALNATTATIARIESDIPLMNKDQVPEAQQILAATKDRLANLNAQKQNFQNQYQMLGVLTDPNTAEPSDFPTNMHVNSLMNYINNSTPSSEDEYGTGSESK